MKDCRECFTVKHEININSNDSKEEEGSGRLGERESDVSTLTENNPLEV